MQNIKRLFERVTLAEQRHRDVVIPLGEAQQLRDELAKLLADRVTELNKQPDTVEIQVSGGKW